MSQVKYIFVGFNSIEEANDYLVDNPDHVPMTMCQGFVQNSGVVCFEVPDDKPVQPPPQNGG